MSSIWRPVPALTGYFDTLERQVIEQKSGKYTVESISAALKYNWDRVQEGTVVKRAKPKTTRSAFTTQEAVEDANEPAAASETHKSSEKSKKKRSGKRKRTNDKSSASPASNIAAATSTSEASSKRTKQYHCTACGGDRHTYDRCYFVLGEDGDKDWLDRGTFDNNMKVPSFKKKVESYRSALKTMAEAKTEAKTD